MKKQFNSDSGSNGRDWTMGQKWVVVQKGVKYIEFFSSLEGARKFVTELDGDGAIVGWDEWLTAVKQGQDVADWAEYVYDITHERV